MEGVIMPQPDQVYAIIAERLDALFNPAAQLAALSHKEILSGDEVALLYNYPKSSQEKDRAAGQGPAYIKRGSRIMYSRRKLAQYFASRTMRTRDQD